MVKVWAEGKAGVERIRKKLVEYGFDLCENEPKIVVVWGGDGSILRSARKYPKSSLLGLREKSVGHLAEIDGTCLDYAVERLAEKEYRLEAASRVELVYNDIRLHGLNEVYFSREYEYATRFRVFVDGDSLYEGVLFGDGCLAASPCGSTAHSWTAGRQMILQPHEKAIIFTPLSSGYLNKRILVNGTSVAKPVEQVKVPDDKAVVVEILRGGRNKFATDGLDELTMVIDLEDGDEVLFRKAKKTTQFIRLDVKQK